jgi:hypothetical protein
MTPHKPNQNAGPKNHYVTKNDLDVARKWTYQHQSCYRFLACVAGFELCRKRGPLDKIHNIVTWIRASPQRREKLRNYQVHQPSIDEGTSEERPNTLEFIADNNTRWSSFFYMLRRATQEKDSFADLIEEEHSKWDGVVA